MLRSLPPALVLPHGRGSILIMDHEDLARTLIEFKLKTCGYDVLSACESRTALRLIHENRPDAIIVETLGTGDAPEVIEAAAALGIPTLVLSSRRAEKDIVEAFELGAVDYITKPFQPGELVVRVARALRQHRQVKRQEVEIAPAVDEAPVHAAPDVVPTEPAVSALALKAMDAVKGLWPKVRTALEPHSPAPSTLG